MQSKISFVYIPIADVICKLKFENIDFVKELKKKYYTVSAPRKYSMEICLSKIKGEYFLETSPYKTSIKIHKRISADQLDFIIRILIEYNLLKKNIILLHASSFIKDGKAFVFMAPSGSGKSTVVKSVAKEQMLGDDVAVIKKMGKKFYVFTSPFDQEKYPDLPQLKAPLAKIFFLKQASFTKITQESFEKNLSSIMYNNMLFLWLEIQKENKMKVDKNVERKFYTLALELLKLSKIEILYFTKKLDFLSTL